MSVGNQDISLESAINLEDLANETDHHEDALVRETEDVNVHAAEVVAVEEINAEAAHDHAVLVKNESAVEKKPAMEKAKSAADREIKTREIGKRERDLPLLVATTLISLTLILQTLAENLARPLLKQTVLQMTLRLKFHHISTNSTLLSTNYCLICCSLLFYTCGFSFAR
jgi:hypothetical protein